ncbi:glycoside hydrolase family 95 protein [Algoriphagus sp.]|uniref:glycoside hydrolase family 95 protein n=1 Tax=Algoriphagus sp. TaxID=1872435 RepID=UPI0025ED89EA|nr:glycoside hydrolase family 95 protein [Algoriphagus sp.]
MKSLTALIALFFTFCSICFSQKSILWYNQPAEKWEEALPVGNGRLGAMVFGKTSMERIQLNEDSMWSGFDGEWEIAKGRRKDLDQVRAYLRAGENEKADSLWVGAFSRKGITRSHQTLGDLWLDFEFKEITDYKRSLDLNTALATSTFKTEGYSVNQSIISSAPDNAIFIKLSTDHPNGFVGKIRLSRPDDEGFATATSSTVGKNTLEMSGMATQRKGQIDSKPYPILEGVKFRTLIFADTDEETIITGSDFLELKGTKEVILKLVTETSFYDKNYQVGAERDLEAIKGKSWDEALANHSEEYSEWFDRMKLSLGNPSVAEVPTDVRIENVKAGETDLYLEKLLFDYGRYLLISSSRPGTNPANLQGIWNEHINAPWNADYHLNINLQMNYWPADVTNLSKLNQPLFDFIDGAIYKGQEVAQKNFDMPGTYLPHATDLWQVPFMRAATAYWGGWVGAGGWMARHYWDHYLFTRDERFLKDRAFPAIAAVAAFYSAWLVEYPGENTLVSAPSTSPENQFINEKGESVATTMGAAMDQQIIADVFTSFLEAARILDSESRLRNKIKEQLGQLRPGVQIGEDGRILEWDQPYEETEKGHRHMSHLYAFHPGSAITQNETPEAFEAVRKTLNYRLENGGAGPGWSRAWLINFSARLLDGEMAHEHIQKLLTQSIFINLLDGHPPFQIDGNFGYTAGVAEMLIQSNEAGIIRLLPALPKAWSKGEVKGIKARGNITVDMAWENGEVTYLSLLPEASQTITLFYNGSETTIMLKKGEKFGFEFD